MQQRRVPALAEHGSDPVLVAHRSDQALGFLEAGLSPAVVARVEGEGPEPVEGEGGAVVAAGLPIQGDGFAQGFPGSDVVALQEGQDTLRVERLGPYARR